MDVLLSVAGQAWLWLWEGASRRVSHRWVQRIGRPRCGRPGLVSAVRGFVRDWSGSVAVARGVSDSAAGGYKGRGVLLIVAGQAWSWPRVGVSLTG